MNEDALWHYLGFGLLVTQTFAVLVLIDMLIFHRPFVSGFIATFATTLHINIHRNPDLPIAKYWPGIKHKPKNKPPQK